MPKWNLSIIAIFIILISASMAYGGDYCGGSMTSILVWVAYYNNTPALSASVSVLDWLGNITMLTNLQNGYYNFSLYIPAYNYSANATNNYLLYFNSSNPIAANTEAIDITDCAQEEGINMDTILIGIMLFFWLGLIILSAFFKQPMVAALMLVAGIFAGYLILTGLSVWFGSIVILLSIALFVVMGVTG